MDSYMTSFTKGKAIIATNRFHHIFDAMTTPVLFVKRPSSRANPDPRSIRLEMIQKHSYPFEDVDFDWPSDEDMTAAGDDFLIHLTNRLDGSFRVYCYPSFTSPAPSIFEDYARKALADAGLRLNGADQPGHPSVVRALRDAFGFNWGARYESPQGTHFQIHLLAVEYLQQKSGWGVRLMSRNVRTGEISNHLIEIPYSPYR